MPNVDQNERWCLEAIVNGDEARHYAEQITTLPEEKKFTVFRNKDVDGVLRPLNDLKDQLVADFGPNETFTTNSNNRVGRDLYAVTAQTHIETKFGELTDMGAGFWLTKALFVDSIVELFPTKEDRNERLQMHLDGKEEDAKNALRVDLRAAAKAINESTNPLTDQASTVLNLMTAGVTRQGVVTKHLKDPSRPVPYFVMYCLIKPEGGVDNGGDPKWVKSESRPLVGTRTWNVSAVFVEDTSRLTVWFVSEDIKLKITYNQKNRLKVCLEGDSPHVVNKTLSVEGSDGKKRRLCPVHRVEPALAYGYGAGCLNLPSWNAWFTPIDKVVA